MTTIDTPQHADQIPALTARDILQTGEKITRLERIPLAHVLSENALIDEGHAEDLAMSMRSELKQISPITVRAKVNDEGEVQYDVVDGFHRSAGMRLNGAEFIDASVVYNISDSELFDLRILAASSVKSVQFARVATWMKQSFATTQWAEKGMTVTHAFGVAVNDTQRVQRVKLDPEEVEGVKNWVKESSKRWMRPITTTYENLRLVDDADPELVKQVRYIGGGKDRNAVVTPSRLREVVNAFPGEENHAIQRAVMRIVLEHRLYAPEAAELTRQSQEIVAPGMDEDSAYFALNEKLRFNDFAIVYKAGKPATPRETKGNTGKTTDDRKVIASLRETNTSLSTSLRALQETVIPQLRTELDRVRRENASLRAMREAYTEGSEAQTIIEGLEQQVIGLQGEIATLMNQNRELQSQNTTLRNQNERYERIVRDNTASVENNRSYESTRSGSEAWYLNDPNVTEWERKAVDAMLRGEVDLEEFAQKNGKTVNEVVWTVRGVLDLRATGDRRQRVPRPIRTAQTSEQADKGKDGKLQVSQEPHSDTQVTAFQATTDSAPKPKDNPENTHTLTRHTPDTQNGRAASSETVLLTDVKNSFTPETAVMAASFFDKHQDLIRTLGHDLPDPAIIEDIYNSAGTIVGNGQGHLPVEAKRVKALQAIQKALLLSEKDFALFLSTQQINNQYLIDYASQLRKHGVFGQLLMAAAEEQTQYYEAHRGNLGKKTT